MNEQTKPSPASDGAFAELVNALKACVKVLEYYEDEDNGPFDEAIAAREVLAKHDARQAQAISFCRKCDGTGGKLHVMDFGESAFVYCVACNGTGLSK